MDRPPADPAKLLATWTDYETGETVPGRALSDLKIGGLRDVVEHLAADPGAVPTGGADLTRLLGAWMEWETGETGPEPVMADLRAGGMRALLEALVAGLRADAEPDDVSA